MESSHPRQQVSLSARRARSTLQWSAEGPGCELGLWYAVASSRLGKPVERRRRWFELLQRVVRRAVADGAALMIVEGTAAAEWIERAAELFSCPTVRIRPGETATKDRLLFELSDRLFVLRARRGGLIARLVQQQLNSDAAKTMVAIWPDHDDAGIELVAAGAVGWWLYDGDAKGAGPNSLAPDGTNFADSSTATRVFDPMPSLEGDWLIHCTRARSGPLPGQTEAQWRDEVLLGGRGGADLSCLEVLEQILQQQCLRGRPLGKELPPVVCFAEVPLHELLARRTFRPHRGRWDYEPFGIAVRRRKLESLGACPVVYADTFADSKLPRVERWRYQATGKKYDWTEEREWRVKNSLDLCSLGPEELVVFVENPQAAARMTEISRWPVIIAPVNV